MTFSEVLRDWEELSLAGRFSFLLRSSFMRQEYQEDDEFVSALDRFANAKFEDLPWQLQDEFQMYVEIDFYRKHFEPKGGEKGEQKSVG
jgi:hypothetical protein